MSRKFSILALVVGMLMSMSAMATNYYCSPTGNGNGLSYSTPCSLATGLTLWQHAGDTLYILGGQYDLGKTSLSDKVGRANSYIVMSGYPGETAIFDFRTTPYGTRGLQIASSCSYVHIKDLTLRYSGKNNLYNEGSYCIFENLDIYGSADTGCQMKNCGHNLIKNCDSHDNFDYGNTDGTDLTFTGCDYGGNADGFADKQHSGASNHYIGCRAWNNSDDGWDFFDRNNSVDATPTIIENCICYLNGPQEYDMRNHARYQTDKAFFDQFANGKQVSYVINKKTNNPETVTMTFDLEHFYNFGNGNGFKIGGNYSTHNVTVHHCLAVANTVKGFDQNNDYGTMKIYNNTGYLNGQNFGFYNTNGGTLYIQNNASLMGQSSDARTAQTVVKNDHNTWNGSVTCNNADFVSLDTTQILAPRMANGDLSLFGEGATTNNTLLHLTAGSDLIDAGENVGLMFMGTAPDLGCFETDGVIRPAIWVESGMVEQTIIAGDSIQPIVLKWMGCDTKPTSSTLPSGITSKASNNNKTLTFTGIAEQAGTYTITTTTACDSNNVSVSFTLRVRPANLHKVAFVTTPGAASDAPILEWMATSDSIILVETDAADNTVDYNGYDAIVAGPAPSSASAGFASLKGYNKPMLVLKPWLFKSGVWSWGTSVNTTDLSIRVNDVEHVLFSGLAFTDGNELKLFDKNSKYTVTGVSDWTAGGVLATAATQTTCSSIMDVPAGTRIGDTTLPQQMVVIGVSEYSTSDLTDTGLQLIENAIYYLLGLPMPTPRTETEVETIVTEKRGVEKVFMNGQIVIVREGKVYNLWGQMVN